MCLDITYYCGQQKNNRHILSNLMAQKTSNKGCQSTLKSSYQRFLTRGVQTTDRYRNQKMGTWYLLCEKATATLQFSFTGSIPSYLYVK